VSPEKGEKTRVFSLGSAVMMFGGASAPPHRSGATCDPFARAEVRAPDRCKEDESMLTRYSDFRDWPFQASTFRTFGAFDLLRQLDRMFSEYEPEASGPAHPRVSFDDQGSAFVVRAEVPGVAEKDIELSATATALTLKGKRTVEAPKGYSTHRSERSSFSFARTFELPAKVDSERAEARLENGVLTVTLPKAPEAQPKQIAVKAG
jgi:HSP20 family protein